MPLTLGTSAVHGAGSRRRPRQALHVCCRLIHSGYRKASPPCPACSVADSSTPATERHSRQALHVRLQAPIERRPRQALHVRLQTHPLWLSRDVPAKPCMSVADCSESSVLRSCTLGPYVPLRRTPSESVSAIGHAGLRRRDAFPEPPCLQSDMPGLGAGTPSLSLRVCNQTCRA